MDNRQKSPQEILKELMPFAFPQMFGGELAKKGVEAAGSGVKKGAEMVAGKEQSPLQTMMDENPLVKKGVNKIAKMQDEMLEAGAMQKDPAGLLQDLVQAHSKDSAQTDDWGMLRKLMFSGGVGMAAMGGNDAAVSGLLGILKEKSKQEKPWSLNTSVQTPPNMEIYGYDSQGNPMFRKIQLDPKEKAILAAEGRALGERLVFSQQQERNMSSVEGKLKILLDSKQKMDKTTQEKTGIGSGRLGGVASAALGVVGQNPHWHEFRGHLRETSTAIAKIAAPSARVGPELIKVFEETLPKTWSNDAESLAQTTTSLTNAFEKYLTSNPEYYAGQDLGQVLGEFKNNIQYVMDSILTGGFEGGKYDKPYYMKIGVDSKTGRPVGKRIDGTIEYINEGLQ
jgi:hypothetical protein